MNKLAVLLFFISICLAGSSLGSCIDSDKGDNPGELGTVTHNGEPIQDYCEDDYREENSCSGEDCVQIEIYCKDGAVEYKRHKCAHGCDYGLCIITNDDLKTEEKEEGSGNTTGTKEETNNEAKGESSTQEPQGCTYEGLAINHGSRVSRMFCNASGTLVPQKIKGTECTSSYECISEVCKDSVCIEYNLYERVVIFIKRFSTWLSTLNI